jgi:hypothetical protein
MKSYRLVELGKIIFGISIVALTFLLIYVFRNPWYLLTLLLLTHANLNDIQKERNVTIVVKGGLVETVYADSLATEINVLDLDISSVDSEIEHLITKNRIELAEHTLHKVYE